MFGPHLTLDLSECDRRKLSDLSHIYDLLDELPDVIGMHKITPPYTFIYRPGDNPSEWGVSGFVIIAESHISIHTFPDRNSAFVDIFSCKQF
ncbi:MAG TPA: S-adenosylmethionine decarboxylase, partial [Candidatus Bathyarchaeia archaeon]